MDNAISDKFAAFRLLDVRFIDCSKQISSRRKVEFSLRMSRLLETFTFDVASGSCRYLAATCIAACVHDNDTAINWMIIYPDS